MKDINILDSCISIKDYNCSRTQGGIYHQKNDDKLWLYVNLTSLCNFNCSFCVNSNNGRNEVIDLKQYKTVLREIRNNISGVSFTGGEPTLFISLLDEAISATREIIGSDVKIYIVTNGTNLSGLLKMKSLKFIYDIHISLHSIKENYFDMSLKDFIGSLDDNNVVLNCLLKKDGVCNSSGIIDYLEYAISNNVKNVSFINMIKANKYCLDNCVEPEILGLNDERIKVITERYDHNYCHCCNYLYDNGKEYIRFYIRYPSNAPCPFARQLVYDSDNKLKEGFNGRTIE